MGKYAERVDSDIQEALYNKLKSQDIQALDLFKKKHMSRSKSAKPKTKELTYDMLPELLNIAKLSVKDMYELIGILIMWPDKDAEELCNICDSLPIEIQEKIKETAMKIAPDFWRKSPEALEAQPTKRAMMILERQYYRSNRRTLEDGKVTPELLKVWEEPKHTTTLKTIDFPAIAQNFEVPLHWLLRLDENSLVLAKSPVTEHIMSAYLFMSSLNKDILKYAVKGYAEGVKTRGK